MTTLVSMRSLRAVVVGVSVILAASAATHLAILGANLLGLRLTVQVFGNSWFSGSSNLSARDFVLYHLLSIASIFAFFVTGVIVYRIANIASWGQDLYKKTSFKVASISAVLAVAEFLRAIAKTILLDVGLNYSDYIGYAAIACLALISFFLIRSASVISYYSRSI